MKTKKILIPAVCVLVACIIALIVLCCMIPKSTPAGNEQNISYEESTEAIANPDQGFYRPVYVKMTEDGASYNQNIVNASTQLYHLRIDISAFSKAVNGSEDKLLTDNALNGLEELLSFLKEREKSAVVRFAYDSGYNGKANQEPAKDVILKHIEQVCPILNEYETTVTAIEAGLIGPWGEMHTSTIANAEHISPIIETFLTNTVNLPLLVRTPKMIYNYLGITLNDIDGYEIAATDKAYRLGIYNDGYLGSVNDLGTYTSREREIEFLSKQTAHLPYGGEVVMPESTLHDIETCLPEMFKINLNYLNIEWNNQVIDKWKNSTYTSKCGGEENYYGKSAFDYIQNRMGYRFLVTNSVFEYGEKFTANLTLKNLGFGNLNKKKQAKLIFTDESGEVKLTYYAHNFTAEETLSYTVDLNLDSGKYGVYLCVYGEQVNGTPTYAVQFANKDMWNDTLKANKIGEIEINKE